jgi:hypothetical protein
MRATTRSPGRPPPQREKARRLIRFKAPTLTNGGCDFNELRYEAEELGISVRTLRRALDEEGAAARKVGFGEEARWVRVLPAGKRAALTLAPELPDQADRAAPCRCASTGYQREDDELRCIACGRRLDAVALRTRLGAAA